MSAVTLRSLAARLGVSTATISMVLNGKPGISEGTRKRVLDEVKTAGYCLKRDPAASRKPKENISLIVYKKHGNVINDTPFFSTLIESIEKKADAEGYRLNIRYLNSPPDPADFDRSRLEGLLLLGTEMDETDLQPFMWLGLPIVVLDNGFPFHPINTVSIDNIGGTVSAVKHLLENGHTKIGYMKSSVPTRNFNERFIGYETAMREYGLRHHDIVLLESTMEGSFLDMKQWLSSNTLTATAFVADSDFIALGAIRALRDNGISLGRDVSVVGFDDLPFARINEPALTTVRVFNDVMGAAAFTRMLEIIRDPDDPFFHTRIGTELKARQSVTDLR